MVHRFAFIDYHGPADFQIDPRSLYEWPTSERGALPHPPSA